MKYSSRFWLYAPLAVLLILAGLSMAYWWQLSGALDRKLEALNGHEAVPGITISYASKTISGFPFNLDVVFTGFAVKGQGAHGPFAWETERFALHRLTYGRAEDIYEAAGQQTLSWSDGAGAAHRITFLPGSLRASAITSAKSLARFDLEMIGAGGASSDGTRFVVANVQFHLRHDPKKDGLNVMASAKGARLADAPAGEFTRYETLDHGAILGPALAGAEAWPAAAAAWRKAGGVAHADKSNIAGLDADAVARLLGSLY